MSNDTETFNPHTEAFLLWETIKNHELTIIAILAHLIGENHDMKKQLEGGK